LNNRNLAINNISGTVPHFSYADSPPGYTSGLEAAHLISSTQWSHLQSDLSSQETPFRLSKNHLSQFLASDYELNPLDVFTFDVESGWIVGADNKLLIWIPKDLRSSVYLPRTITILSSTRVILDLSNFACGSDWIKCKLPDFST
jgi:hypothetical protein